MRLFEMYPLPWSVEADETIDPDKHQGGYVVRCATGVVVMNGGTYTGDGDMELNLDWMQAKELVGLMNREV